MGDILRLLWFWLFGRRGRRGYWVVEVDYTRPGAGLYTGTSIPGQVRIMGATGRCVRILPRDSDPLAVHRV